MTVYDLPAIYTSFNGVALIHIIIGLLMIKIGQRKPHIASMSIALLFSLAFLGCYLYFHFNTPQAHFAGTGWTRPVYFTLLLTHIPLAVLTPVLVFMTVMPALKHRFDKHKRLAKVTVPVWIYVSVTGILVYLMCYQWYGPPTY